MNLNFWFLTILFFFNFFIIGDDIVKELRMEPDEIIEYVRENVKKDRWFPKGYDSYELLIKHPKLFTKKLKIEYSMKKTLSAKIIKDRAYKSDIFFFKPPSEKEIAYKELNQHRDYQNSDIFNIKNDKQN